MKDHRRTERGRIEDLERTLRRVTPNGLTVTGGGGVTLPIAESDVTGLVTDLAAKFKDGGNSFGALATLGTNDAFDLAIERNNTTVATFNASGLAIASMTLGSVLFAGASGQISQDNANFFWDDTNNQLKIAAGAVGTPSLYLSTDTTTGLYRVGANNPGQTVSGALIYDWTSARLKLATGKFLYLGATADICGDVGDDYIAITDSVNGGVRGQIKNTATGGFSYGQWACINNLNNDTCLRINNSTLAVAGLHNTAGASVLSAGPNGTTAGPGLQPLIIVNANNDASSDIWFGTRGVRRAYLSSAGFWGFATTNARTPIEAVGALSAIRVANSDNSANYADFGANTLGELVVSPTGGTLLMPAASGSTFSATSYGITFADVLDAGAKHGYKIGFDSVGGTRGYLRYNVDNNSAGSATWGHVFSGGPMSGVTSWAFIGGGRLGVNQMTPRARVDFLDASAVQLKLSHTDNSVYTDFQTLSTGFLTITPTGGGATIVASNAVTATPILALTQGSTGDAAIRVSLGTTISYAFGVDNSVSGDPFVLATAASANAAIGTGNLWSITALGYSTWSVSDTAATPFHDLVQSSTGDAALRFAIGTTNSFIVGVDNSDSDKFKVSYAASGSAALGTNDYFIILTNGSVGVNTPSPTAYFEVTDNSGAAIRVNHTPGSVYTGLQTDSSGNFLFTPTGPDIDYVKSAAGVNIRMVFFNTDNTNAASHATVLCAAGGASGGDPVVQYLISGVTQFATGIDNSDSDKYKISASGSLGTLDALTIKTSLVCEHASDVTILDSAKGLVLKDTAGTPHYWRVTVSAVGALTTTDLGTTAP